MDQNQLQVLDIGGYSDPHPAYHYLESGTPASAASLILSAWPFVNESMH